MPEDFNSKIIEEFRANGGKVGGSFEGAPILLLHTHGAKTGSERVNPVMYREVDGGYAVFASKASRSVTRAISTCLTPASPISTVRSTAPDSPASRTVLLVSPFPAR